MRAAAACLGRRVGLRGAALLLAGIGWTTYGIGIITDPRYVVQRGVSVLTRLWPLDWWGAVWIVCGLLALAAAVLRPGRDAWGFGAVVLPPLVWAGAYIVAWLTGRYPAAWTSTPAWCVPSGLLIIVAALSANLTTARRRIRVLEKRRCGGE